jgi:DnaJ homologue, subfamily C, member 28, conserved domain
MRAVDDPEPRYRPDRCAELIAAEAGHSLPQLDPRLHLARPRLLGQRPAARTAGHRKGIASRICPWIARPNGHRLIALTTAILEVQGKTDRTDDSTPPHDHLTRTHDLLAPWAERKPPELGWERWIDRLIREATERGEFEDLPGAGEPVADLDKPFDEMWWVQKASFAAKA